MPGAPESSTPVEEGEEDRLMGRKEGSSVRLRDLTANKVAFRLSVIVSLGGFLFGVDTAVISGALPYLRTSEILSQYSSNPERLSRAQENIVSSALYAAFIGSALGGYVADVFGRRRALLTADFLFVSGSLCMAFAGGVNALVVGRIVVGLAIGVASVTAPVYIAECSPPRIRAALVTLNVLAITGGQFCSYLSNYFFSFVPGTWRWMLGIAALPAAAQALGLWTMPESPTWLAGKGHAGAAARSSAALQLQLGPHTPSTPSPSSEVYTAREQENQHREDKEDEMLLRGVSNMRENDSKNGNTINRAPQLSSSWRALGSPIVLRQLHVGVGLQILQQASGINTAMYFAPTLMQAAGVRDPRTALLASLIPAATNAVGTVVGLAAIERCGRRRLLLTSLAAVVLALMALGGAFHAADGASPLVVADTEALVGVGAAQCTPSESTSIVQNPIHTCVQCIRQGCGFCTSSAATEGVCIAYATYGQELAELKCSHMHFTNTSGTESVVSMSSTPLGLYTVGCPSRYAMLTLFLLVVYLAAFSPGVGPVPWAVNSEIYPVEVRGLAAGIAAAANWAANAVVAQVFLTSFRRLGGGGTFWSIGALAAGGWVWAWAVLPETKGLSLEEIQRLFGAASSGGGGKGRKNSVAELDLEMEMEMPRLS